MMTVVPPSRGVARPTVVPALGARLDVGLEDVFGFVGVLVAEPPASLGPDVPPDVLGSARGAGADWPPPLVPPLVRPPPDGGAGRLLPPPLVRPPPDCPPPPLVVPPPDCPPPV